MMSIFEKCASEVKSGDSTNRESLAARDYFSQLLDDATRRQPMWYNSALNYSYSLVPYRASATFSGSWISGLAGHFFTTTN